MGKLCYSCCTLDIHIANGRFPSDKNGEYTCFANEGKSIVDYTLLSTQLFHFVKDFRILERDEYTHLPQLISIAVNFLQDDATVDSDDSTLISCSRRKRLKWQACAVDKLEIDDLGDEIAKFNEKLDDNDVTGAADVITDIFSSVCLVRKTPCKSSTGSNSNAEWWDDELDILKKKKYKCLRLYRLEHSDSAFIKYCRVRKSFKSLVRKKKYEYKLNVKGKLESCTSASDFWKVVRSFRKKGSCSNKISPEVWNDYFQSLLNKDSAIDENFTEFIEDFMRNHDATCDECADSGNLDLDRPFTVQEVAFVVDSLDSSKSPGIDGVGNDCIKGASKFIVPILCRLFNKMLETSVFPDTWCNAIIVPIHKSGSVHNPNNFRGIALLSCLSKIFTKLLNERLVKWAHDNQKMFEEQGGFTKGKGTTDQIFILQSLNEKYLSKKGGRCYNVFVDFSKAFDSVPHLNMFYKFVVEGLHGKVLKLLRNMYNNLKSCVQVGQDRVTEVFECKVGTRQGCMLSPFFFIFYLNEFIQMSKDEQCKGIYVSEQYKDVNMLLYADDIVLIGDQVGRVQKLLNVLSSFCYRWGLSVNMDKTKMLVYRNGGIIRHNEKCYFNGIKIENVSYYKYLGVLFSTRMSWTPAQENLAAQARKAMYLIEKINYSCEFSYLTSCELLRKCIIPIITYGGEIWGVDCHNCIESLLHYFCRKQLGVGSKTPIPALLAECGQLPIYITCKVKVIKYWLKIISSPDTSLVKACYEMMYRLSSNGRINWATKVKNLLYSNGFGFVWEQQSVDNPHLFLKEFRTRLEDCFYQNWNTLLEELPKLRLYKQYKLCYVPENYLLCNIPRRFRVDLAKFRVCSSKLEVETGRYLGVPLEDRKCKLCLDSNFECIEDEFHVLIICPSYSSIREIYLGNVATMYDFVNIMSNQEMEFQIRLAHFVHYMFMLREAKLSNLTD